MHRDGDQPGADQRRVIALTPQGRPLTQAVVEELADHLRVRIGASLFSLAVLFQAGLYAANGADRIQERYFFYVVPLAFRYNPGEDTIDVAGRWALSGTIDVLRAIVGGCVGASTPAGAGMSM